MAAARDTFALSWREERVTPLVVERALARLLRQLNPPEGNGQPHPPARASVANLVVRATSTASAEEAAAALGELADRHPSRTLVIVADLSTSEARLDAAATVHCHLRPGTQGQACFEQVYLTARGGTASHLAGVAAPLLIPDLPVILWWLDGIPPAKDDLLALCDRLIVDSSDVAPSGLSRLARLAGSLDERVGLADLAWGALHSWRQVLARLFDPPEARAFQRGVTTITLTYAEGGSITRPLLLLGWLATRLDWMPERSSGRERPKDVWPQFLRRDGAVEARVSAAPATSALAPGEVLTVGLRAWHEGQEAAFEVSRHHDGVCATARIALPGQPEMVHAIPLSQPSLSIRLCEELDEMGSDATYRDTLSMVGRMLPGRGTGPVGATR